MPDPDYIRRLEAIWPPVLEPGSPEAQQNLADRKEERG